MTKTSKLKVYQHLTELCDWATSKEREKFQCFCELGLLDSGEGQGFICQTQVFLFLSTEDQISGRHMFQFLAQNLELWDEMLELCTKKKFCKFYLIQNTWKINLRKKSECEPVFSPAHDALWIHFAVVFHIHPGSVNRENCQMFQLEFAHSSDGMWQSVCYSQELLMFYFQAWTASQQLKSRLGALCWSVMVPCHHRFERSGC